MSLPALVLTRALPAAAMELLAARYALWCNPEDRTLHADEIVAAAAASQAEILLVMAMDRIDAALIARLPESLRVIATYSVGNEHLDLAAARARGIAVLSTPDVLSDTVAETAIMLMLGAARRAREAAELIQSGAWTGWSPTQLLGRDLGGARLGIFGMGRIGRAIARKAGAGFGMAVHYHNRTRLDPVAEAGASFHADAEALVALSDFLILAAPSTPATRGFLNAGRIARLPPGAVVVNVARGDLIDDEALLAALHAGQVSAGLDVFNGEPAIHPGYRIAPNAFIQPHQGSSTLGTRLKMARLLIASIEACRAGEAVANRLV